MTFGSRFFSQELTFNGRISSLNTDYVLGLFFSDEKLDITRVLDWGTQAQTYWNVLLKGKEMPIPAQMSMAGKWQR